MCRSLEEGGKRFSRCMRRLMAVMRDKVWGSRFGKGEVRERQTFESHVTV